MGQTNTETPNQGLSCLTIIIFRFSLTIIKNLEKKKLHLHYDIPGNCEHIHQGLKHTHASNKQKNNNQFNGTC